MALKLITGPSGSGKTRFLFEYALKEADIHPDRNYLVIVPEQFTLSTQKELVRLSKKHGILNVDVLSFNRLSYRIFEEVGFKDLSGTALDDMGKNLILMHVSSSLDKDLKVFSGKINKLGYITEIKSAISEFMQYGINPSMIDGMIESCRSCGKQLLAGKLSDISKIYAAFNDYISNKYITTEEVLTKAAEAAYKSEKLKQSVILFDGFTGFTPVQYALIESLVKITIDTHFTILTDTRDIYDYNKEHELFYLGYKTKEKLYSVAKNNNVRIENEHIIADDIPVRFSKHTKLKNISNKNNSYLVHLEKNIFRKESKRYNYSTDDIKKQTQAVNSGICLFCELSPIEEVTKAAVKIRELTGSDTGMRYKDIAIAAADIDSYMPHFKRIFELYNIPYFIDRSQPVLLNPFIEFVRASVNIFIDDFSYNSVMRLLRSPFLLFEKNVIDEFDNFILAKGVRGYKSYCNSFAEKYGRNLKIAKQYNLNTLDIVREKMLGSLSYIVNSITHDDKMTSKKPTISVNIINQALINTFDVLSIEHILNNLPGNYKITDDLFENNHKTEYESIYKNTVVLLNKMSELLGDEIISLEEYSQLLDAGFDEIRIGIIPKITDYIHIGDTTRSRFNDIQVLFIVGANDSNIPGDLNNTGVISDVEKEFILVNNPGLELAPTSRDKAYTNQLYLYMLMTKPESQLFISYSRLDNLGESLRPSYLIRIICDMFPSLNVESDCSSLYDLIYNYDTCMNVLADNIHDDSSISLLSVLFSESKNPSRDRKKLSALIDCAFMSGVISGSDSISRAVANVLYGKALVSSVTRLEEYARCAFKYYLKFGLSLAEREIFSFDSRDMGSIFHSALEKYSYYLSENGMSWTDIDDDTRKNLVLKAVSESIDDEAGDVINSTFRSKYMLHRMTEIVDKSVEVLTGQLAAGSFTPRNYELSFKSTDNIDAFTFKLSDDEIMKLSGKIDRLDTYETEDKIFIKVIDYKSGNLSLDLLEIYKGRQLQLVVYMNACREILSHGTDKEIIPAGILYYYMDYPVVEGSIFADDDAIADAVFKGLKMKGLVNNDENVYRLIDNGFDSASDIIPVKINKDKSLSLNSSAVSTEDFDVISAYVNKKICSMGKEILSGNIKADPGGADIGVDCMYCPYTEVCKLYMYGSSSSVSDEDYDILSGRVSREDVLNMMREEV